MCSLTLYLSQVPPHIFAIADGAYQSMVNHGSHHILLAWCNIDKDKAKLRKFLHCHDDFANIVIKMRNYFFREEPVHPCHGRVWSWEDREHQEGEMDFQNATVAHNHTNYPILLGIIMFHSPSLKKRQLSQYTVYTHHEHSSY